MRTLIQGGWVVGFSAETHCLIPDGTVILEGGSADDSASGVRINAVNPGSTESPMVKSIIDGDATCA